MDIDDQQGLFPFWSCLDRQIHGTGSLTSCPQWQQSCTLLPSSKAVWATSLGLLLNVVSSKSIQLAVRVLYLSWYPNKSPVNELQGGGVKRRWIVGHGTKDGENEVLEVLANGLGRPSFSRGVTSFSSSPCQVGLAHAVAPRCSTELRIEETRSWRGKNRLTNARVLPAIALRKARRVATAAKSVGMQVRQTIRVNADTPVAGSVQRETPN